MIAEFFYPKELKDIVVDLRAKDGLNERVIDNINTHIKIRLFVIFIITVSCWFLLTLPSLGVQGMVLFFVAPPLSLFLFIDNFKREARQTLYLYNFGERADGICTLYKRGELMRNGAYTFQVQFSVSGDSFVLTHKGVGWVSNKKLYEVGDTVPVCYDSQDPNNNLPFIPSLEQIFYLRKKRQND